MLSKKITSYILLIFIGINLFIGDLLVYALVPDDIGNKVFFLDGQDTDADGNINNEPLNNQDITNLVDKFNSNTGSQIEFGKNPIYQTNSINTFPSIYFNGTSNLLNLKDNLNISTGTGYSQKSYAMIIKTSDDINTMQTIYDEGTKEKGFSFQIENAHLYAGVYNTVDWSTPNQYKVIDLGIIDINTVYTILFIYDNINNNIQAYLNGNLINTLSNIGLQSNYGACNFETAFNCTIYSTGGTLAIGATKNDTLQLSNNTSLINFEGNFFKGNIGEIISWNYALNNLEIIGINDYLFSKWGIDLIKPVITSTNFLSGSVLPGGNHNIQFNYNDTHTGSSLINIASDNIELYKWNGSTWGLDISNSGFDLISKNITSTIATYPTNNLLYGKYRAVFNISDNAGNISNNTELTFYIDEPEIIVSTGSLDIGILNSGVTKFSPLEFNITVRTVGAGFNVILNKSSPLLSGTTEIIDWNTIEGVGYEQIPYTTTINTINNNEIIATQIGTVNTDGNKNTYTYSIKIGALISEEQSAGDYSSNIRFGISLNY